MPRKYQGPLQPGKRTAKVPKSKSKKGLNAIERKQVNQILRNKKEVYYIPCMAYSMGRTLVTGFAQDYITSQTAFNATNGAISLCGVVTGNPLGTVGTQANTVSNFLKPMGGVDLNGDASNPVPIEGDKAIMKSMKLNLRISANLVENISHDGLASKAINFRVIVFKLKKQRPAGEIPNLNTGSGVAPSLFKDLNNNDVGITDYVLPFEFEQLRCNPDTVKVLKDKSFQLMNPLSAYGTSSGVNTGIGFVQNSTNLPATKDISIYLPCPKTPIVYGADKEPSNWDYRTYAMVFATRNGGSYQQTTDYWHLEANMCSKVQEY